MIAPAPIRTPFSTMHPAPIQTLSPMTTGAVGLEQPGTGCSSLSMMMTWYEILQFAPIATRSWQTTVVPRLRYVPFPMET